MPTTTPPDAARRADEILAQLTVEERVRLCSGADFWRTKDLSFLGLPAAVMSDGPSGIRRQARRGDMLGINRSLPATCFPAAVTAAGSWDPALLERLGAAVGRQARALGVDMVLGPGANIKRNPLCGRNFEYFSEDPLLSGSLAAAWIRGVEGAGVQSCLKHLACNNQEYLRFQSDSIVDARTLREINLRSFERAVRHGGPSGVMSAYNRVNGTPCSGARWLLTDVLRRDWGFDGVVVSDWGGMADRTAAFAAGCDLSMPGGSGRGEAEAQAAVRSGALDALLVDASARRVIRMMLAARGALSGPPVGDDVFEQGHRIAYRAAVEGAVLLRNEPVRCAGSGHEVPALPLAPLEQRDVAFIGSMARRPRYQGAGSSRVTPWRLVSPLEACPLARYAAGCRADGSTTGELLAEASAVARGARAAVVFCGLPDACEGEGFDRATLALPEGHARLIEAVAAANPRTIVVLMCGGAVEAPWADEVGAILYMGLAGEAVGEAVRDLVFGDEAPSGRLAESWPVSLGDAVCAPYVRRTRDAQYREGVYVGYRYHATAQVRPRWAFGHGLTYTAFSYEGLAVRQAGGALEASVTVRNVGRRAGTETVQLYLGADRARPIYRPARELLAFERVELEPGAARRVTFTFAYGDLSETVFAVWDGRWVVPRGAYRLWAGPSSADTPLEAAFDFDPPGSVDAPPCLTDAPGWYRSPQGHPARSDFEELLGRPVPGAGRRPRHRGSFTEQDSIADMARESLAMRAAARIITLVLTRGSRARRDDPVVRMALASSVDATLASLEISSGVRPQVFRGLLEIANGHWARGIKTMLAPSPRPSPGCRV